MRVIDILEAQARLEELIDELAPREWFAIAVDGVPKVKVIKLTEGEIAKLTRDAGTKRIGGRKKRADRGKSVGIP